MGALGRVLYRASWRVNFRASGGMQRGLVAPVESFEKGTTGEKLVSGTLWTRKSRRSGWSGGSG